MNQILPQTITLRGRGIESEIVTPPVPLAPPTILGPFQLALNPSPDETRENASLFRLALSTNRVDMHRLELRIGEVPISTDDSLISRVLRLMVDLKSQSHTHSHTPTGPEDLFRLAPAGTLADFIARCAAAPDDVVWTPLLDQLASTLHGTLLPSGSSSKKSASPQSKQSRFGRGSEDLREELLIPGMAERRERIREWAAQATSENVAMVLSYVQTPLIRADVVKYCARLTPAIVTAAMWRHGTVREILNHPSFFEQPDLTELLAHLSIDTQVWNTQMSIAITKTTRWEMTPSHDEALYALTVLGFRPEGLAQSAIIRLAGLLDDAGVQEFGTTVHNTLRGGKVQTAEEKQEAARVRYAGSWGFSALFSATNCPAEWTRIGNTAGDNSSGDITTTLRRLANPSLSKTEFVKTKTALFSRYQNHLYAALSQKTWNENQLLWLLEDFGPATDLGLFRLAAQAPNITEASAELILLRADDDDVRDSLAANPSANGLPNVRAKLGRCRAPQVLAGLLAAATPEEFENLWPRLVRQDPAKAVAILESGPPALSASVKLHRQHFRPLLVQEDKEVRERAIRLMGRLQLDAATERPKAKSPASSPRTP